MYRYLKFSATWCQPCQVVAMTIAAMNLDIDMTNIDIDSEPNLVKQYNIRGVPTIIKLENEVEVDRVSGTISKDKLQQFLE